MSAYTIGYFVAYNWPLIALLGLAFIFRDAVISLMKSIHAHIKPEVIKFFALLKTKASPSIVDVPQPQVPPELLRANDWDLYEVPSYIRKAVSPSF